MRIDEFGEVGTYLTAANEPVLAPDERVIGFRQLEYRVFKAGFLRSPLTDERGGWVWQTTKRVIHLDDKWEEVPTGAKGKRVHEYTFEEAAEVSHRGKAILVAAEGPKGKVVFMYSPFGAASRLFQWLRREKEERRRLARGEVQQLYGKGKPPG
ncbi:MAG: hypothetical protein A3K65_01340 [Euryarchaeota archaeon RBG_16_68_12]|nr:MAG: hypothetical protein A3K65_01340 [Euryarchaeota archaeon RBG_16_68_12]